MPEDKGIFEKLYAASKEVLNEVKKPLVKNKIKRKLKAANDDAFSKIDDAESAISKIREDFENYDVNKVLQQRAIITQAKKLQDEIAAEYQELFAETIPTEE